VRHGIRRSFVGLAAFGLTVGLAPAAAATQFDDVPDDHVHADAIERIVSAGIASGYGDGTFGPSHALPRAQMATFLAHALDLDNDEAPRFPDVAADDPHADAIAAVDEAGLATGYADGTFGPRDTVNRGQMAAFLAEGYELDAEGQPPFDDVPADHVHADAVAAVAEAEVAFGYFGSDEYRPADDVTRAQMATFLDRAVASGGLVSTVPREGDAEGEDSQALLADVRTSSQNGYDRVVFEFAERSTPNWSVSYDGPPFHEDPSGEPLHVDGESFLSVGLQPASGRDAQGNETYAGDDRVTGPTAAVTEVVQRGDHHGAMGWIIGLDQGEEPFRVQTAHDPFRVIVDVATG
jgi:hypothetical protein